jgi:hypothetical protein
MMTLEVVPRDCGGPWWRRDRVRPLSMLRIRCALNCACFCAQGHNSAKWAAIGKRTASGDSLLIMLALNTPKRKFRHMSWGVRQPRAKANARRSLFNGLHAAGRHECCEPPHDPRRLWGLFHDPLYAATGLCTASRPGAPPQGENAE